MAGPDRLRRVLVANRGEIARRIIAGAHHAGLEAVAVYAPDDARAPHVTEADAAVALPSGLAAGYLSVDALLEATRTSGADALHPGYGFLAEDPALARACAAAGVVWVGPPPGAMEVMGHKARAKDTVAAAGVPVLPGAPLAEGEDGAGAGAQVGFPLLVKASAGGGGRGMRQVGGPEELAGAVAAARREAAAAFGSGDVFLERVVARPRHVEVQVVSDREGTTLHLFDRECSVQRRHQKVVEEAPAALVPRATRERLWHWAVEAARAVGYEGVGTVEFLVDDQGQGWFLEMNTRLQVEHGVTELVTGLDLVGLQLAVAAGRPLGLAQADVGLTGHAVEVRLCAERPAEDDRPTPGRVDHVRWPAGAGIRVDAGVVPGSEVSAAYDSLVAKVMAHGPDRDTALGRLRRALADLELDGLETNRDLLAAIVDDDEFVAGRATTDYLARRRADLLAVGRPARRRAAAAAALRARGALGAATGLVPGVPPAFRTVGRALQVEALADEDGVLWAGLAQGRDGESDAVAEDEAAVRAALARAVPGPAAEVRPDGPGRAAVLGPGPATWRVRVGPERVAVNGAGGQCTFSISSGTGSGAAGAAAGECRAPLPGQVLTVLVGPGDAVAEGDGLVVVEAMKMEHTLRAAGAGRVGEVKVVPGDQVDVGQLLVSVEPA
jgi:acetyl/propionyl-CoA carboxylase alpha subunit